MKTVHRGKRKKERKKRVPKWFSHLKLLVLTGVSSPVLDLPSLLAALILHKIKTLLLLE
jgi:hypothetical protein